MEGLLKLALEPLGLLGGSVLFGIALYLVFRFCDGFFPPQIKREVASRLQDTRTRRWALVVIDMMDRVLVGKEPGARWMPRFWRVTALSFLCMLTIFFSLLVSSSPLREQFADLNEEGAQWGWGGVVVFFLILNPVVDYISTFETRLVLGAMSRRHGVGWLLALAGLDLIATVAIALFVFSAIMTLVVWLMFGADSSSSSFEINLFSPDYFEAVVMWIDYTLSGSVLGVYVYTTFATTVWTWLYLAAEGTFRILPVVRRYGPVEEKPFRSLGLVVALLGGACWFAIGVIDQVWNAVIDTL